MTTTTITDYSVIRNRIDGLTKYQQDCLGAIAMQSPVMPFVPGGWGLAVLNSLIDLDLVMEIPIQDGLFTWTHYGITGIRVHMAYCEWCGENVSEDLLK